MYHCIVSAIKVPGPGESHEELDRWVKAYDLIKRQDAWDRLSVAVIDQYGVSDGKPGHFIYRVEKPGFVRMFASPDPTLSLNFV